jgi:hypothetical protein
MYIYENSEPNSKLTYPVSITKKSLVMLLRELIPLYCKIYVKRINAHPVGKTLSFLSLKKIRLSDGFIAPRPLYTGPLCPTLE